MSQRVLQLNSELLFGIMFPVMRDPDSDHKQGHDLGGEGLCGRDCDLASAVQIDSTVDVGCDKGTDNIDHTDGEHALCFGYFELVF